MKNSERVKRLLDSPNLTFRGLNRVYHRRGGTRSFNSGGVDIFDEDWDNLIILDACRYDLFKTTSDIDGELEPRYSRGSSTFEFLSGNVRNRELLDTVYVTANPQLYKHRQRLNTSFHEIRQIWLDEGWDEQYQTVLPETVVNHALDAYELYPDKRLLIHFMQPHYPFIGNAPSPFTEINASMGTEGPNCWDHLMRSNISVQPEDIWTAYRANLERVVPSVKALINTLGGKTVVTSDHGNMIGEKSSPIPHVEWGHPRGIYTEQLIKVPWLTIESDRRRSVTTEPSVNTNENVSDGVVSDRLKQLGYLN